ncbi:hypothetical protein NDA11_003296 [Ustilago hordei]|uniref:Uncharacterized protein n=1 Tax=Ustilago hordei TaxID=120017 RepID=I2FP73_USTHO|nr:uncharacterized protein UHO2_05392 [Ustilago hordei]KAJ1580293.1 hypothetical protein NDA11_003296 [Ustilago hordei]CCF48716.1 uncharacterized protein UHOR_06620 [Ustilago hordei]SYW86768.1 uncharacterized protein UHO2_05392 [Ustilago hordei]
MSRIAPTLLLLLLAVFLLLLSSPIISAHASGDHALQQPSKRSENGPAIEFATTPQEAANEGPALIEPQYNQFAPPPTHRGNHHDRHHHGGKGLSKNKLEHWMHKLGLHPTRHQIDQLYSKVNKHDQQHHRGQGGRGKQTSGKGRGDKEKPPVWKELNDQGQEVAQARPVSAGKMGILPPGTPRKWDSEEPSDTNKSSSPVAAAVAPLPEPAPNTIASPTRAKNDSHPPAPGQVLPAKNNGLDAPVTNIPSNTAASSNMGPMKSGTSGSINPSATASSTTPGGAEGAGGAGGKPKTVAGIPVVADNDGDMKAPQPQLTNSTSAGGRRKQSGATGKTEAPYGGWTVGGSLLVASLLVVVLFAI